MYSRDMMSGSVLDLKAGNPPHLPDFICWPETTAETAQLVKAAYKKKIPIIPFGGGSGVSGGTLPLKGGVMVDMKRMDKIESIDSDPKTGKFSAVVQTGILGAHLERDLNERAFTLGHFPSSIMCATLGGYLAARSAGQLSSKYGKIEDMVEDIETVLPDGRVVSFGEGVREFPKIRPKDLFVGSEGCLGLITRARLKIHPLVPMTRYRGLSFNRLQDGLDTIRQILQCGLCPAVVRLYDSLDTALMKYGYGGSEGKLEKLKKNALHFLLDHPFSIQKVTETVTSEVLLILGFEGDPVMAYAQEKAALKIASQHIHRDLGEKPGLHWLHHRYSVSFKMPKLFLQGCFVDTIEVATTWDNLLNLYQKIRSVLTSKVLLLAHFSHAYPEGCSIYFTLIGRTGSAQQDRKLYDELWDGAMETCLEAGGTISHHHGIGILKAKFLPRELGRGMEFYRQIKKKLDPDNLMNPGKMGL